MITAPTDVAAFVWSKHLTTGQRAMAVALAYPEKRQGKRTSPELEKLLADVSFQRLHDARAILDHEDLVEKVLAVVTGRGAA